MSSEKIQLILFNIFLAIIICGLLYYCSNSSEKKIKERIAIVNSSYEYSSGMITDFHSYKGHGIEVKYIIKNKSYNFKGGWDKNPKNLKEGDSIKFRYYTEDPQLIITELENEY